MDEGWVDTIIEKNQQEVNNWKSPIDVDIGESPTYIVNGSPQEVSK